MFPKLSGYILQDTRIPVPLHAQIPPRQEETYMSDPARVERNIEPVGRHFRLGGSKELRIHTEGGPLVIRHHNSHILRDRESWQDANPVFCILDPGVHYWCLTSLFHHNLRIFEADNAHWDAIEVWVVAFETYLGPALGEAPNTVIGALPGCWIACGMTTTEWQSGPPPYGPEFFPPRRPAVPDANDALWVCFHIKERRADSRALLASVRDDPDLQGFWVVVEGHEHPFRMYSNALGSFLWCTINPEDEADVLDTFDSKPWDACIVLSGTTPVKKAAPELPHEELTGLYQTWKLDQEALLHALESNTAGKLRWIAV